MVCADRVGSDSFRLHRVKRVEPAAHGFRLWGGRFTAGVGIVLLFAVWVALFRVRGSAIPSVVGVGYFVVLSVLYFARIRHCH